MITTRILAIAIVVLAWAACSRESPAPSASAPTSRGDSSTGNGATVGGPVGVIEVRVTYAGKPVIDHLSINKDVKVCGTSTPIEKIVVGDDHGLAEAVISVVGLTGVATAKTAELDQRGCQFRPHVLAIHTGDLEVLNSDGVLHNLHTYSKLNPQINKAQPKFKKEMTVSFEKPEVVKLTCDVHSWMQGWLVVLPSSYFAVTDDHGVARVADVPEGQHTVEVWQERLGRRRKDVTVKAGSTVHVDFEFPAAG
jgi:plastocyanin